MENKTYYIKSILKNLGIAVLAFLIVSWMRQGTGMAGTSVLAFVAVPFGWPIVSKIFSWIMAFGFIGIIIYFVLMVACSALVGWPIMIYRLVKDTVMLVMSIRAEKMAAVQ